MFVLSNRNIVIPGPAGTEPCRLARGYMGPVPDWAPETPYFKALAADGKIVPSQSPKDKDVRKGRASAEKARRAAGGPEEPQDDPGE